MCLTWPWDFSKSHQLFLLKQLGVGMWCREGKGRKE